MNAAAADAPSVRSLARRITRRLRLDAFLRAGALGAILAAAAVTALEIAARIWVFPESLLWEAAALGVAVAAAALVYLRRRPHAGAWRDHADAICGEPGVFSAAAATPPGARLAPLVAHRADSAAALLLAGPRERRPLATTVRVAIASVLVAGVTASLPGRRFCSDDLALRLTQAVVLDEVRALRDEAAGARNGPDAAMLDQAAAHLAGPTMSAGDAQELARRLKDAARGNSSRTQRLADALAAQAFFRELAQALRHEDAAAVKRAIEELAARARDLDPRSKEALEAAAALLGTAADEPDPLLKNALVDAGQALSGDGSSSASEGLRRLDAPLQRTLRYSQSVRDVAVLLEGAVTQDREALGVVAIPAKPARRGDPDASVPGPAGSLPGLGDYRALVRPGTSDEAVLRRYFSVP
jgi:hypothetical protein